MMCRLVARMFRTVLALLMVLRVAVTLQVLKSKDLTLHTFDAQSLGLSNIQTDGNPNYFRYLKPTEGRLLVGAMNYVFDLSLTDLTLNNNVNLPFESKASQNCKIQGKKEMPECQNHIRVIMVVDNNSLFVCGTGAYSPMKYTLSLDLQKNTSSSGRAYCPYDPLDNSTSIYVENGNPGSRYAQYFGTYRDFSKNDGIFLRPAYTVNGHEYSVKLTNTENANWLYYPQFVGSFDMEDEVYFFFREVAVEYMASNVKIFSRVGKVCKQDAGGGSMRDKWLSFQKSRLLCSLPGQEPYYFDDIYDVYQSGDYFYALFYKQGGDLDASAICVYEYSDIVSSFRGDFKYNPTSTCEWKKLTSRPELKLDNCTLHKETPEVFSGLVSRYQLMDTDVEPVHGKPIYYKSGVQFLKLVVDERTTVRNIYVASADGLIYSIFMKDNPVSPQKPLIVEHAIYKPFETQDTKYAIWSMKFQGDSLYLGTDYSVTKLDLSKTAEKHTFVDTCIYDAGCKWACSQSRCYQRQEDCCAEEITITADNITVDGDLKEYLMTVGCIAEVSEVTLSIITGVYATLDINYSFSRTGQTVWKKDGVTLTFEDTCTTSLCNSKYFLASNTGSLIIKNVTMDDIGTYKAYDKTTEEVLITHYAIDVVETDTSIVNAWKQSFVEWAQAFKKWKGCSNNYLEACSTPGNEFTLP